MKRHIVQLGLTLILATMATACATVPKQNSAERLALFREHAGGPVSSFSLFGTRPRGWSSLGDQALAVWTRPGQAYLLDLTSPCQDLNFATAISISNLTGRVAAGFDNVYVRGGANSGMRLPCRINTIRPIDIEVLEQAERDLQEATTVEREQQNG